MTDEIKGAVAEALKEDRSGANITPAQLAARRLNQSQPEPQPEIQEEIQEQAEETEVEEPVAEVTEEVEEVIEEPTEETQAEDVLSQYNLDEMSEEELEDLSKKLGSRAVARYGELTAKRKAAEEKLAELQRQMSEQKNDILQSKKPVENNPYSNLETVEALQDKAQEVNEIIGWAEDILFESDGYSAEDQLNKLQQIENGKQLRSAFEEQAKQELSWLQGEDNDTRKQYESMLSDKRFIDLQDKVDPDISAQLPYLIAHAANSMYGRKLIQDKPKVSITPPKTGATSAPNTSRATKSTKALADLSSRFKDSGNEKDFIKLRTKQLTK
jgi:hypothetical protein